MFAAAVTAARMTRLVTADTITAPIRSRLPGAPTTPDQKPRGLAKFAACPWCIGWWIAIAVFAAFWALSPDTTGAPIEIAVWFAASCATNLIYAATVSGLAWITATRDRVIALTEAHLGLTPCEVEGDD